MRALTLWGPLLMCLGMAACGGGGSDLAPGGSSSSSGGSSSSSSGGSTAANVVSVVVDAGPSDNSVNTLFTTVTICVPGSTTQCQTIDHIQVDTASWGLRVLAPVLTLTLPGVAAPDGSTLTAGGNALAECTQFVDGYSWGPVVRADLKISGESASSLPIQIIGDSQYAVPSACSSAGGTPENTVAAFGANGIIGIGVFKEDCGSGCASNTQNGFYFSCTASGCSESNALLTAQVLNPIPFFATDNNGSFVVLPAVAAGGAASVTGSLIFGIDTQSNNQSGTESVVLLDGAGNFTTVYNGKTLASSFIDTGSNGLYFDDQGIPLCSSTNYTGFYCPTSTLSLSGTIQGTNSNSTTVSFSVANAQTLSTNNPSFTALPTLGGAYSASANPGSTVTPVSFDWGLPFYYGRRVAAGIETYTTSAGTGPYVAF